MITAAVAIQMGFKVVMALFLVIIARYSLHLMDRAVENKAHTGFSKWLKSATDEAKGVYYGARIVGVMVAIGLIFS